MLSYFTESEAEQFRSIQRSGRLNYFEFESKPALCKQCNELVSVGVLRIVCTDGTSLEFQTPCPNGAHSTELVSEPYRCPKCGETLTESNIC